MSREPKLYPEAACKIDANNLKSFITAGKCTLTLRNSQTKIQKTYFFCQPQDAENFPLNTMFVYVLSKQNTWLYLGMLKNRYLRPTKNTQFSKSCKSWRGAEYLINVAEGRIKLSEKMLIYHCGTCCVCGRKLTSYKSIIEGIGPRCKKYLQN